MQRGICTQFLSQLDDATLRDREFVHEVLDAAFPRTLSAASVAELLRDVAPHAVGHYSQLDMFVAHELLERASPDDAYALLGALVTDPFKGTTPQGRTLLRPHLTWLGELVCKLLTQALSGRPPDDVVITTSLDLVFDLVEPSRGRDAESMNDDVLSCATLRQALFWRRMDVIMRQGTRRPRKYFDLKLPYTLMPRAEDITWLEDDVACRTQPRERLLAYHALLSVVASVGDEHGGIDRAARLAAGNEALEKHLLRWRLARHTPEPPWEHRPHGRWRELNRRREERERSRTLGALQRDIDTIRSGTNLDALLYIYRQCVAHSTENRYGLVSFDWAAAEYGSDIANCAREGLKATWHTLESQPVVAGHVTWLNHMALGGLGLEVADGLRVSTLDAKLIRSAIRHAAWELNGFPEWMTDVAQSHPDLLRDEYEPALRREYGTPGDQESAQTNLFGKFDGATQPLVEACAPVLVTLLEGGDPPKPSVLRTVLRIVSRAESTSFHISTLAPSRTAAVPAADGAFPLWWREYLEADADGAITHLEMRLGQLPRQDADAAFLLLCAALWDRFERAQQQAKPLLASEGVGTLERFTRLAFLHVRPGEDIDRVGGGVYSPVPRDDAQSLRHHLFSRLLDHPEFRPADVDRLAADDVFASSRDFLFHIAEQRRCTLPIMTVPAALKLVRDGRFTPESADDLFTVACTRTRQIREHVEAGDFSPRQTYVRCHEDDFQVLLADQYRSRAAEQYSVAREERLSRKWKPDIRLSNPSARGPVCVEVKVAERHTLQQLTEGLAEQLVGKYLQAVESRHGLYVLCSAGPTKKKWRTASRELLDLEHLVIYLQRIADDLVRTRSDVDGLRVIAIDFH